MLLLTVVASSESIDLLITLTVYSPVHFNYLHALKSFRPVSI